MSVDQLRTMLIGSSEVMEDLRKQIAQVANTTATVLVWGESGTGKELVARGIHSLSSRFAKNLVPLNCGAIPKELFESDQRLIERASGEWELFLLFNVINRATK